MHQLNRRHQARCWFDRQLQLDSWERPGLSPLNWAILALIGLSVILFTIETEETIAQTNSRLLNQVNLLILLIFFLEFSLRLWSSGEIRGLRGLGPRTEYAGRFWLAVDFVAFAPELLVLGLLTLGVTLPFSLEGLKAIRLLRLLKIGKFVPAARIVLDVLTSVRYQLLVSAAVAAGLIYLSAVAIYYLESSNDPEHFGSVIRSLWWSVVTLTTVGYGDVVPNTVIGKLVAGLIAIIGVGIIALPSGIIAGAFMDKLREDRRIAKDTRGENA